MAAFSTRYTSTKHTTTALCGLFCLSSSIVFAATYNLAWDPVDDSRVAGYRVHYGNASGTYTEVIDVGKTTQHSIGGLAGNQPFYFIVTAYDGQGNESPASNEVQAQPQTQSQVRPTRSDQIRSPAGAVGNSRQANSRKASGRSLADGSDPSTDLSPATAEAPVIPKLLTGFGPYPQDGGWTSVLSPDWLEENRVLLDWPEYNALSGETRPATGDIDGDGRDELVIGLGPVQGVPGVPGGIFQVFDDDLTPLAWGKIDWVDYNSQNGETLPAVGDIDGDGRAEIIVGLGAGGGGMMQVFSYQEDDQGNGTLVSSGWTEVGWPEYAQMNGETRPALGDIDGDSVSELIIGLGTTANIANSNGGGNFVIKDGITGMTPSEPGQPSALLGSDDQFFSLSWLDYAGVNGETWPATGDLDQDGRDDVILGLGEGADGTMELFHSEPDGYLLPFGFAELSGQEYGGSSGAVRPSAEDLNGDGIVEVIASRGVANEARVELFDNVGSVLVHKDSLLVRDFGEFTADVTIWPAVKK
ncbi:MULTISPECIES: FG-GAP-like repeat-containing protein [Thiorhodovibrio]|uniref:FG-GAP-like repeat-containing protein n=1 Tax=Thiorhodovibrio TaxID=61593 RepID=UPI0019120FC4|nr:MULTISPECIES: FG-GAP-like repeat-containing protein [Thiorhodovibrio]MBK5970789.1 hypothetical protein [Thiorhodovibrio winogradskyi]WPL10820.1 FG-GAP repeat [Thiorhodovibrio litoralis]